MADNVVSIIGNVTRDPEQRVVTNGQSVTNFGLAVNRRWLNRQTEQWEEETSFFDVVAWAQLGENIVQSIEKGSRVIVMGRLQQRSWDDSEGQKRSKVEIVADEVAPSLRWATATVTKQVGQGPGAGNGGGTGGGTGGYSQSARPAAAAQPRTTPAQRPVQPPSWGDEEPF